jgi:hypothetical protein
MAHHNGRRDAKVTSESCIGEQVGSEQFFCRGGADARTRAKWESVSNRDSSECDELTTPDIDFGCERESGVWIKGGFGW